MTDVCLNSDAALDLQGRTAKAHVDKWQHYGEKAQQHALSAGSILSQVRKGIEHGQWLPWLKQHDIASRTAQRLMLEYQQPEKAHGRQEKDRLHKKVKRQAANTPDAGAFQSSTTITEEDSSSSSAEDQTRPGPSGVEDARRAIIRHVDTAPTEEVRRIYTGIFRRVCP